MTHLPPGMRTMLSWRPASVFFSSPRAVSWRTETRQRTTQDRASSFIDAAAVNTSPARRTGCLLELNGPKGRNGQDVLIPDVEIRRGSRALIQTTALTV